VKYLHFRVSFLNIDISNMLQAALELPAVGAGAWQHILYRDGQTFYESFIDPTETTRSRSICKGQLT